MCIHKKGYKILVELCVISKGKQTKKLQNRENNGDKHQNQLHGCYDRWAQM